jgi:hypothetical protein
VSAPPLLVVHAWGDTLAATRWTRLREAWDGPVVTFDLPGHRAEPPPTGASYALGDAALYAERAYRDAGFGGARPVVLGDSSAGFGGELLAAAGRAVALVLVDGLGGPWVTPADVFADGVRWCNEVFADDAATAPFDGGDDGDVDPRLRHGFPTVWVRDFTEARRRSIAVPVLAIETPASPTPRGERDARLKSFSGPAVCVEVAERSADCVGDALREHAGLLVARERR